MIDHHLNILPPEDELIDRGASQALSLTSLKVVKHAASALHVWSVCVCVCVYCLRQACFGAWPCEWECVVGNNGRSITRLHAYGPCWIGARKVDTH